MTVSKQAVDKLLRDMQKELQKQKVAVESKLDALALVIEMNESRDDSKYRKQQSGYRYEIADAIQHILQEESPLHRDEITKRLKKRSVHIGGENPVASVGTILSRDDCFVNVSRGMWALVEDKPTVNPKRNGNGVTLAEIQERIASEAPG